MNQPEQQTESILSYIETEIIGDPTVKLEADSDLLIAGYLDSVTVVRLVAHMENLYSITIPPEDILIENFSSVKNINDYLTSRLDSIG